MSSFNHIGRLVIHWYDHRPFDILERAQRGTSTGIQRQQGVLEHRLSYSRGAFRCSIALSFSFFFSLARIHDTFGCCKLKLRLVKLQPWPLHLHQFDLHIKGVVSGLPTKSGYVIIRGCRAKKGLCHRRGYIGRRIGGFLELEGSRP